LRSGFSRTFEFGTAIVDQLVPDVAGLSIDDRRLVEHLAGGACRVVSYETLLAKKTEFDVDHAVWVVPPERMKARREHRVPLSRRALKIVKQTMADYPDSDFPFPGQKPGKPLSTMALEMILRRMKVDDATVHGFRYQGPWSARPRCFDRIASIDC
jgi:integrase